MELEDNAEEYETKERGVGTTAAATDATPTMTSLAAVAASRGLTAAKAALLFAAVLNLNRVWPAN